MRAQTALPPAQCSRAGAGERHPPAEAAAGPSDSVSCPETLSFPPAPEVQKGRPGPTWARRPADAQGEAAQPDAADV